MRRLLRQAYAMNTSSRRSPVSDDGALQDAPLPLTSSIPQAWATPFTASSPHPPVASTRLPTARAPTPAPAGTTAAAAPAKPRSTLFATASPPPSWRRALPFSPHAASPPRINSPTTTSSPSWPSTPTSRRRSGLIRQTPPRPSSGSSSPFSVLSAARALARGRLWRTETAALLLALSPPHRLSDLLLGQLFFLSFSFFSFFWCNPHVSNGCPSA